MTTWFVSRHPGAIEWIKKQPIAIDRWVSHLDVHVVAPNDIVIGVLPLDAVAALCAKGAVYYALSFCVPEQLRGTELSVEILDSLGCELTRYDVRKI